MYSLAKDISALMKEEGYEYIEINCDSKDEYYRILDELVKYNADALTVYGTSKEQLNIIVEQPEELASGDDEGDD